jgi:PPP family 3-phenylpropionic acid transporter
MAAYYFFYFATLGTLIPYWPVYLKGLGLDADEIGLLFALLALGRIVSPLIAGTVADGSDSRMGVVRGASVLASLAFVAVWWADTFVQLVPTLLAFGFFFTAGLSPFEVNTLAHLGTTPEAYSRVRLWGSVGFIAAVAALGACLGPLGTQIVPITVAVLVTITAALSFWVPEARRATTETPPPPFLAQIRDRSLHGLLLSSFLIQVAHGPYYTFFTLYLEDHAYSSPVAGGLWALGVAAEIGLFLAAPHLLARFPRQALYSVALGVAALRWCLLATLVDAPVAVFVQQLLHGVSFGLHHTVAMQYLHRLFPARSQGRGLALYAAASFGAGGALGSLLAGLGWERIGAEGVFLCAGVVSLLALQVGRRIEP